MTPVIEGQGVEVCDALAKLCTLGSVIEHADASALGAALLLLLREKHLARGGRLGTWKMRPKY